MASSNTQLLYPMSIVAWVPIEKTQLGLRETVSKGRDRHPYIPVGLSRPSDWLSPSPHPIAPQPLLLVE
ncbi:hypothetical protein OUZ56_027539 [Daphnia magna]|uniref:Uncharacterized protein n=1 Tax=Daphnia magna TaxID=35525 RepID=A0ABQ9ZRD3_9CRUS|nr:hypothetical protein OUZ56_027539 [Daphnia magna]